MRRFEGCLPVAVIAGCGLALAACGLSATSDRALGGSSTSGAKIASTTQAVGARTRPGRSAARKPAHAHAAHPKESRRELTAAQRIALAKGVARTALAAAGFTGTMVHVGSDGLTVAAFIPSSEACTAQSGDQLQIEKQITQLDLFLRSVTVGVADSDLSLSGYLTAHCTQGLPAALGRIIYEHAGSGMLNTPAFAVHARRWSVDYQNQGSYLSVFVVRNGKVQPQVISATHRATGSRTFTGAGGIRLQISGSGHWTVHVRDGS